MYKRDWAEPEDYDIDNFNERHICKECGQYFDKLKRGGVCNNCLQDLRGDVE